jgi:hypothetical protein
MLFSSVCQVKRPYSPGNQFSKTGKKMIEWEDGKGNTDNRILQRSRNNRGIRWLLVQRGRGADHRNNRLAVRTAERESDTPMGGKRAGERIFTGAFQYKPDTLLLPAAVSTVSLRL